MLGNLIELSIIVRDLEAAIERYTSLFGLKVHSRAELPEYGLTNAILPTGIGHIELLQPTDPSKPAAHYLETHGEGVYLVGFEVADIPSAIEQLRAKSVNVAKHSNPDVQVAWVHPRDTFGVLVELRKRQTYG